MLYGHECPDRGTLGDSLGPGRLPNIREIPPGIAPPLSGTSALLLWSTDPGRSRSLPEAIVVGNGGTRDVLAWITTYAPSIRPFTSQVRVLELEQYLRDSEAWRVPTASGLDHALAGLMISEAMISGLDTATQRVSAIACQSTVAWALLRGTLLRGYWASAIAEHWQHARVITSQRERRLPWEDLHQASAVLAALGNADGGFRVPEANWQILEACDELRARGEVRRAWIGVSDEIAGVASRLRGPRESRLVAVEHLLDHVDLQERSLSVVDRFALAYCVSAIVPGSLAQSSLAARLLRGSPGALIWLSLCAGLHPEARVGYEFGGVGLRVVRDLLVPEPLVSRPRADIALAELEMLTMGNHRELELPTGSTSTISIEIAPGITTVVPWGTGRARLSGSDMLDSPVIGRPDELSREDMWRDLGATLMRASDLYFRLGLPRRDPQLELPLGGLSKKSRRRS